MKTKTTHTPTPGPWKAEPTSRDHLGGWMVTRGDFCLATASNIHKTGEANARLIAAAPALLACCKTAYAALGKEYADVERMALYNALEAAIEQAEGGTT